MYQGEFIKEVLAGKLSEQDIKNYINEQPKKDLPGLLVYIHDKQGAIIAEGMFKDKGEYFNFQWRDDFNKLYAVAELVKAEIKDEYKSKTFPDVLDTDGFKCQFEMAKDAGLISKDGEWIGGPVKLAVYAMMINKTNGAMKPHRYVPYWKPFEDLFGKQNLSQYFANSSFSGKEDKTDCYQEYLYGIK